MREELLKEERLRLAEIEIEQLRLQQEKQIQEQLREEEIRQEQLREEQLREEQLQEECLRLAEFEQEELKLEEEKQIQERYEEQLTIEAERQAQLPLEEKLYQPSRKSEISRRNEVRRKMKQEQLKYKQLNTKSEQFAVRSRTDSASGVNHEPLESSYLEGRTWDVISDFKPTESSTQINENNFATVKSHPYQIVLAHFSDNVTFTKPEINTMKKPNQVEPKPNFQDAIKLGQKWSPPPQYVDLIFRWWFCVDASDTPQNPLIIKVLNNY